MCLPIPPWVLILPQRLLFLVFLCRAGLQIGWLVLQLTVAPDRQWAVGRVSPSHGFGSHGY